jgi:hypothetical protein
MKTWKSSQQKEICSFNLCVNIRARKLYTLYQQTEGVFDSKVASLIRYYQIACIDGLSKNKLELSKSLKPDNPYLNQTSRVIFSSYVLVT